MNSFQFTFSVLHRTTHNFLAFTASRDVLTRQKNAVVAAADRTRRSNLAGAFVARASGADFHQL